ncbi:MAG: hypothetical protein HRT88_23690, partial [Lentisphaeraceae bacterium]|nr:hypothetical protein [Lentisphaeraceae bacterium]
DAQRDWLEACKAFLKAATSGPEAIDQYLNMIRSKPINKLDFALYRECVLLLALEDSETLYKKWLNNWAQLKVSAKQNELSSYSLKLQRIRFKNKFAKRRPYLLVLKKKLKELKPDVFTLNPAKRLRNIEHAVLITEQGEVEQKVDYILLGQTSTLRVKFWIQLMQNYELGIDEQTLLDVVCELFEKVPLGESDAIVTELLMSTAQFYGSVGVEGKKRVLGVIKKFSKKDSFPESSSLVRVFEYDYAMKAREEIDFAEFFRNVSGSLFSFMRSSLELDFYLAQEDHHKVKLLVDKLDEQSLLSWRMCADVIPALRELKKTEELELVKASLVQGFDKELKKAWYEKDHSAFAKILRNAQVLSVQESTLLKRAYEDFCRMTKHAENRLDLEMLYAEYKQQWQVLFDLSKKRSPRNLIQKIALSRALGIAAYHLGKNKIASKELRQYIALENADYEVTLAKRLLEKLK